MTSIFRSAVSLLLGLALAAYGLVHTMTRYPPPAVFDRLAGDLPSLAAVLVFALGVAATLGGVLVVVLSLRRLRRGWRHLRAVTAAPTSGLNGRGPIARGYGYPPDGEDDEIEPDEREWVPSAYR
jgi:hypothetical protein